MSVYTAVSEHELACFLENYALGAVISLHGIEDGIENTNYFLTTTRGEYVLTLFEQTDSQGLPFCLELMAHLATRKFPAAGPVRDIDGNLVNELNGKPAAIVQRLTGASVVKPEPIHCAEIGKRLAELHTISDSFQLRRANERGASWHTHTAERVRPHLTEPDRVILDTTLKEVQNFAWQDLPQGVIHADLFRDNALFDGTQVSGVIDFYYAHIGCRIYDLGVLVADWCFAPNSALDDELATTMIDAYTELRPLHPAEIAAWGLAVKAVALRFWLSRLHDALFPRRGEITHTKNPSLYRQLLQVVTTDPSAFQERCFPA